MNLPAAVAAHALDGIGCLAPVVHEQQIVDVDVADWLTCADALHDAGAVYLDFLTAYIHGDDTDVVLHVCTADLRHRILVRTHVVGSQLPSLTSVFSGADWHEREMSEMFGLDFAGHPGLSPLLLPRDFNGHPLLKSFPLTPRVAQPWPGEVEPGEVQPSQDRPGGTRTRARRKPLPPGVQAEWMMTQSEGAESAASESAASESAASHDR